MKRNIPSVDRISGLPDALLCHILSFLPTKFSVATSILSRRWRLLWTEVPVLKFDIGDYDKYDCNDDWEHASYFAHIVDKALLLHSVENLITFRLNTSFDYYIDSTDDEQNERWITNVIARKVQNLDLCLDYMVLPQSVFTCKTLVDLRLVWVELLLPEAVCFPNLKKLDLIDVRYKTDEALPHLISGCPVLEKLVIDTIIYEDMHCMSISSPTIKWLELKLTMDGWREFYDNDYRVEINVPALRYLRSVDWISKHISAHTLTSLIEADVFLVTVPYEEDKIVGYSGNVLECIDKLCNVKYLELSLHYSKVLDSDFSASTVRFNNLTRLRLSADARFISKFLKNADNLQVLIINQNPDNLCWMEPQQVPTCLSSHLTTIKIYSFNYAEHEFKMIRYLLMNTQVLKRMEIYSHSIISDYKKKFHGLKRISEFPRGSAACELYFN